MLEKIDAQGNYTSFPGVTIISNVVDEERDFWNQIHAALQNSEAKKYCSFTPVASYHMTVVNLFTKYEYPSTWNTFLRENKELFVSLREQLNRDFDAFSISYQKMYFDGSSIKLLVTVQPEKDDAIVRFAEQNSIDDGLPIYHITLGHCYKDIDEKTRLQIKADLETKLGPLLKQHPSFALEKPELCSFENMTKFTPWDGVTLSATPEVQPRKDSDILDLLGIFRSNVQLYNNGAQPTITAIPNL